MVALGLFCAVLKLRANARWRAQRRLHESAARETALPSLYPNEALQGIPAERVQFISQDAEAAAVQVARGEKEAVKNPHPLKTREFVLWEATFQSVLSDFTMLEDVPSPVERRPVAGSR